MARRCALFGALYMFFLCLMPDPLLAARLVLREFGTGASDLDAMVGDEIEVSLWVDSDGQPISGAAVFLSFDETVFDLVDEDRQPAVAGFQPFAPAGFLGNGEIFRNALLDADDPAASASGEQLDYSVVRALDQGSGPAATFRLRVLAPSATATVRIDENGFRETRFFTPDGSHQSFRFITPLSVRVRGIGIEGLPERLVLSRGQTDTTTFQLDRLLFDPVYGPDQIDWSVASGSQIGVEHVTEQNLLRLVAPDSSSPWDRVTVTATNPDGQSASAFVDVFVNAAPELPDQLESVTVLEDTRAELSLEGVIGDPDTPIDRLTWSVESPAHLEAGVSGSPPVLHLTPAPDWHGSADVRLSVTDDYGFADTTGLAVTVDPSNDVPRILVSPNVRLTRGRSDSTLFLAGLIDDVEDGAAGLHVRWSGQHHIGIEIRSGRLILTAPPVWIGEEVIQLEVEDTGGLTAAVPLTVTVERSLAPSLQSPPERLGLTGGDYAVVDLAAVAVDPDDTDADLAWSVTGAQRLQVQLSNSGTARIEAPADFGLPEVLRFAVTDPSGETASFDLMVFPASADGAPAIAPLPEISLPAGGVDASLDLDDYLFDLDHQAADMEWFLPVSDDLTLRIDPASHVLTVAAADSTGPGVTALQLRVRDPDGLEAVQTFTIHITAAGTGQNPAPDPGAIPALAALPTLTLTAGGFDQSLDLDDFVTGVDPSLLSWQATGQQHLQVFVDPATRQVTVLAESGWSGPEIVVLTGSDAAGNAVEGLLGIQVLPPVSTLRLRDLTEAALFAGDSLVVLDAAALLDGPGDPNGLSWSVRNPGSIAATYSPASGALELSSSAFGQPGARLVDLVARDSAGAEASGRVLLQVHPVDGSTGAQSEDLRVVVVPNAVQPDFLDIFVVSQLEGALPRLRLEQGEWSEMVLDSAAAGIWQGRHILQPGHDGSVRFLALAMDTGWQPLAADFGLQVATAGPGAGKRLALGDATVDFGADAFDTETVVALMPAEVGSVGDELVAAGSAVTVYATRPFSGQAVQLSLDAAAPGLALYRWDEDDARWSYLGGEDPYGDLAVTSTRLGRFAALSDEVAPRLVESRAGTDGLRLRFRDGGSGMASVTVLADGIPLAGRTHTWDGTWLTIDGDRIPAGADVAAEAVDRAGNRVSVAISPAAIRPVDFALGHNYPNPFNPETTIPVQIVGGLGSVRIEVYNTAGQRLRVLHDEALPAGRHNVVWDGRDGAGRPVSSGVYFYRATAKTRVETRRMTLAR